MNALCVSEAMRRKGFESPREKSCQNRPTTAKLTAFL
jgi:hypothetical protein